MASVLVVDDEPTLRRLISRSLLRAGFTVTCAENGFVAWRSFESMPFDVVLSDVRMPAMNGFELLQRIRARFPDTPLILMSGSDELRNKRAAITAGAFDFLAKPIRLAEIERAVLAALVSRTSLECSRTTLRSESPYTSAPRASGARS